MADEIPTGDKAVFAFFEMVALAFAFEGVSAMLNARQWPVWSGALLAALAFFLLGIKWRAIRASFNSGTKKPVVFWIVSILLVWLPVIYDFYDRHSGTERTSFPLEFDSPDNIPLADGYGMDRLGDITSCFMNANAKVLVTHRSDYKLAIGCFVYDGTVDRLDAPNVQVNSLYDITEGVVNLRLPFTEAFNRYREQQHSTGGIIVALFMVPDGVSVSQFATLRQARSLGVRIVYIGISRSNT